MFLIVFILWWLINIRFSWLNKVMNYWYFPIFSVIIWFVGSYLYGDTMCVLVYVFWDFKVYYICYYILGPCIYPFREASAGGTIKIYNGYLNGYIMVTFLGWTCFSVFWRICAIKYWIYGFEWECTGFFSWLSFMVQELILMWTFLLNIDYEEE